MTDNRIATERKQKAKQMTDNIIVTERQTND